MGRIGTYMSAQLHSEMLVAPPKTLAIGETEIGWFEIMTSRAIRGEWIEFRNTSQNEASKTNPSIGGSERAPKVVTRRRMVEKWPRQVRRVV
jgi:hypothetical protein